MKNTPVESMTQTIEDHLGITKFYSFLAFVTSLNYPSPKFFKTLSITIRLIWTAYARIAEFSIIFMITSNTMLLILEGRNSIAVQTECIGSIALITYMTIKTKLLYRTQKLFTRIVKNVHKVAEEFANNPINSKDYFQTHAKHFTRTQTYCKFKTIIFYFSVYGLIISHLIQGLIANEKTGRHTPMLGWFPFSFETRVNFATAILLQTLSYPLLLGRDSAIDIIYMTILSVISNQFLYLGQILGKIIKTNPSRSQDRQTKIISWWLTQHKKLIEIVNDFQKIAQVWLFLNYAYVSFLFFLVLLRLTVDSDFVIEQQISIIAVNAFNLIHLFVISSLGDAIAKNSTKINYELFCSELFEENNPKQQYTALVITTRCTRPVQLKFADNRILAIKSFSDIMKSLLGYFTTIYQLRN